MWILVVAVLSVVALTAGLTKAAMVRHRKRQQRSMRDHLARISTSYE